MILSKALRAWNDPNGYLYGEGGRKVNNYTRMQGLSIKSLKHHVALQPLFVIIGGGMIFVTLFCGRLASKTTDVNWTKQKDPLEVMNHYDKKQFKWFNPAGIDYSKQQAERPNYKDE